MAPGEPPLAAGDRAGTPGSPALARVARAHGPALGAALAGVVWLALQVGLDAVDPRNVGWLMHGDWAANHLGWLFFRSAPFSLPLGANPLYPYPVGSTLGFTDSIPLVAIALRPVASVLPQDFQYVGAWLLAAFALQGFVGAKLVKLATPNAAAQALGGALFALAPPLLHRLVGPLTGHASLCAHWIVLVALWLALAPVDPARIRARLLAALLLVGGAAGVHPYFVVMTAALAAALVVRLAAVERRGVALLAGGLAAAALAAGAGLALFGFVGNGVRSKAEGFGYFSSDLATLVNPMGWSRALASLPVRAGQYEGFGYLGGGVLLLAATAIVLALVPRGARPSTGAFARAAPVAAVAVLLFAFALSDAISWGGERIAKVGLYALVPALGGTFRSSGRFVWPVHYVVLLGAIALLAAALRSRPRVLVAVLAIALGVQAADVAPPVPVRLGAEPWRPPGSDVWGLARGAYRHLAMYPPYLIAGGEPVAEQPDGCGPPIWPWDAQVGLAHVAYRLGATFNGSYAARLDPERAASSCQELYGAVARGQLDGATIYVVHAQALAPFRRAGASCGVVDGAPVCVSGERNDPFAQAVRLSPLP